MKRFGERLRNYISIKTIVKILLKSTQLSLMYSKEILLLTIEIYTFDDYSKFNE